jgi:hypothetical protein
VLKPDDILDGGKDCKHLINYHLANSVLLLVIPALSTAIQNLPTDGARNLAGSRTCLKSNRLERELDILFYKTPTILDPDPKDKMGTAIGSSPAISQNISLLTICNTPQYDSVVIHLEKHV